MRKIDWLLNVMIVVAAVLLVLSILSLASKIMRSRAEDEEVREIMAEAQERRDLYRAASVPAIERPAEVVVAYEPAECSRVTVQVGDAEPMEDWYIAELPLSKQMQKTVFDAATENGVDYFTALALIKIESGFRTEAANPVTGCYGLCQLNPAWFPTNLTPEENVRAGLEYLGRLIEGYGGDVPAALRAYNRGYDDGNRHYPNAVLSARAKIMDAAGVVET